MAHVRVLERCNLKYIRRFDVMLNFILYNSNRVDFFGLHVFLLYPELFMYKYNYSFEAINCINCVYRDLLAFVLDWVEPWIYL